MMFHSNSQGPVYALAWSGARSQDHGDEPSSSVAPPSSRLAIGSFREEHNNRIQVLGLRKDEKGYVDDLIAARLLLRYWRMPCIRTRPQNWTSNQLRSVPVIL